MLYGRAGFGIIVMLIWHWTITKARLNAGVAELADALVSKTSEGNLIPVRSRSSAHITIKSFAVYLWSISSLHRPNRRQLSRHHR